MSGGRENRAQKEAGDAKKLMIDAIRKGSLSNVKKLVHSHGSSCFDGDNVGNSLIYDAIMLGHTEIAKFLLQKGVRVEREGDGADTLLHLAIIKHRSGELVRLLLEKNVQTDARNAENETPLHLAAKNGDSDIVRELLDSNASVTAQTTEGATPLLLAAEGRHEKVVEMLLKHASANVSTSSEKKDLPLLNRILLCTPSACDRVDKLVASIVTLDYRQSRMVEELAEHGFIPSRGFVNKALLSAAVEKNYVKLVKNIMMSGDIPDDVKADPLLLHCAVEKGHKEIVELLLSSGFDANAKNEKGQTCLNMMSSYYYGSYYWENDECAEIIRLLLANGADMKEAPYLLNEAIKIGLVEVCKVLIDNGADLNALNGDGETPLHLSCDSNYNEKRRQNKDEIVRLLLEKGADGNIKRPSDGWTALHLAACRGRIEAVSILIQFGVDVDSPDNDNETPLRLASQKGHKDIVQMLCENKANVNARNKCGQTPLHCAAYDRKAVVEVLIMFGADIDSRANYGSTPLHYACYGGNKEIVKMLCENKASVDSRQNDGQTPLHRAARIRKADAVEVLIMFGADIDSRNNDGSTPLHYACYGGNKEIVKMLCENKASVDSRQNDGQTPLHIAASRGLADVVEVLLSFGADINARVAASEDEDNRNNGCTPLHLAARWNCADVVGTLVKFGCDAHARGPNNETALHCAFSGDRNWWSAVIVTTLLDEGIDVNAVDRDGNTALDCAIWILKAKLEECQRWGGNIDPRHFQAIDALKRQLIKLKAAGFHVRDIKQELRQFYYSKPAHAEFQEKCEEEVNRLKSVEVNPQLTLHDILVRRKNPYYARNESLMQEMSSFNFDPFPLYGRLIAANLRKSKARLDLMESGQKWLNTLIKTSGKLNGNYSVLPVELVEWTISYLDNTDLSNLIACGEALKRQLNP